jgi:tetratricopeptide (TPR) repeat protein
MQRSFIVKFLLGAGSALLVIFLIYQLPPVHERLFWRVDFALTYVRGVISPPGALPTVRHLTTPTHAALGATATPAPTATPAEASPAGSPAPSPTPPELTPVPTQLPAAAKVDPAKFEEQGPNNCGPATLSAYLRFYGWDGNQQTIADLVKPNPDDRNVNVEELTYFVHTKVGWLNMEYRVGMNVTAIKQFLAAGMPVMIEEGMHLDQSYWPNDDLWAGHYLFITGYDDATQSFTTQDSFYGPNRPVAYTELDRNWHIFNRVLIMIYRPEMEDTVKSILGDNWDADINRKHALETAQAETQANPKDAYAWFNTGTNLTYFTRYSEAADAYDQARGLGLPQRMLRYQFGPFIAYFHTGRLQDLNDLVTYALHVTPTSEEALLWNGWSLFRSGDKAGAEAAFKKALSQNSSYQDAKYAINFLAQN